MAINSYRMVPDRPRVLGHAGINGLNYSIVGTFFDAPVKLLHLQNLTDVGLLFSYNGLDDYFALPANGYLVLDVGANQTIVAGANFFAQGDGIWAKSLAGDPTVGAVYLTTYIAKV